jgi:hypothetical protein
MGGGPIDGSKMMKIFSVEKTAADMERGTMDAKVCASLQKNNKTDFFVRGGTGLSIILCNEISSAGITFHRSSHILCFCWPQLALIQLNFELNHFFKKSFWGPQIEKCQVFTESRPPSVCVAVNLSARDTK